MPEPLVSTLMACYNAERLLPQAIESVLAQTHVNWELLCVDDGSTDSTYSILERHARRDGRIRLVKLASNRGAAAARNAAMELAQGTYIAVLDADDVWLPDRLERSVHLLEEADAVGSDAYVIDERGKRTGFYGCGWDPGRVGAWDWMMKGRHLFVHPSLAARREAWPPEGYNPAMVAMQDTDLELRMLARGAVFTKAAAPLCCIRERRPGTLTTGRAFEGYFCKLAAQMGAAAIARGAGFDYERTIKELGQDPSHVARAHLRAGWMVFTVDPTAARRHLAGAKHSPEGSMRWLAGTLYLCTYLPRALRHIVVKGLQCAADMRTTSVFTATAVRPQPKRS